MERKGNAIDSGDAPVDLIKESITTPVGGHPGYWSGWACAFTVGGFLLGCEMPCMVARVDTVGPSEEVT